MKANTLEAIKGDVRVEIGGKSRRLVLDYNAIAAIEAESERNMLTSEGWKGWRGKEKPTASDLILFLWAALLCDEPTLTLADVGRMIRPRRVPLLVAAVTQAIAVALTSDDTEPKEAAEEDEDPPSAVAGSGSISGPSPASISDSATASSGS